MRSPTLAPSGPTPEPVHLVLCDFGKLGNFYVETQPVTTEADVMHNILTGQYVSEDIAGLVVVVEGEFCDPTNILRVE